VRLWKDRSASGYDLTVAGGSTDPTYAAAALGAHGGVRFSLTPPGSWLESTGAGIAALGTGDRTVFLSATIGTTKNVGLHGGAVLSWPGCAQGIGGYGNPAADSIGFLGYAAGGQSLYAYVPYTTGSTRAVASLVQSTSGGQALADLSVDSRPPAASAPQPGPWKACTDQLLVGSPDAGGTPLDGDVGEVIVIDRVLSPDERRQVEEYLARKWSQPITPSAPTNVTAAAGGLVGSVDVSWTAPAWDGGSAITEYTATAEPSGLTCTAMPGAGGCTISGLTSGVEQTVTVTATNAVGVGPTDGSVAKATPS
jgi:hypothetical protein